LPILQQAILHSPFMIIENRSSVGNQSHHF
jgi:hypothetical protein